jgi:glutamyl-tRNA reductase
MSELLAIGVSYKTAPVETRERLALGDARAKEFIRDLHGVAEIHEAVVLSTCNRTELYLEVGDPLEAETAVLGMLARQAGIGATELAGAIYAMRNCDAARHLYRVTAGLESMIVGEAEIQGQVKRAYEAALARETTGPLTNHLFRAALATGKRVRTETAIGERHLSLASVGVSLVRETLGDLSHRSVLIIGSGEMGELAARSLADSGCALTFVSSRKQSRAAALVERFGGERIMIDELPDALLSADVVVAATASPHVLIDARALEQIVTEREGRPLLILDLAVPRDVDSACRAIDGVTLFDVDDLQAVVARNRRVRQSEADKAVGIVEEEIQSFATWLGSLEVLPTVAALRQHAAAIAEGVLADNAGHWESASEADLERVDVLARAIVTRLLHTPTLKMKELVDDRVHARMALIRELFGLDVNDERALGEAAADASDLAEIRRLPEPRS